MQEVEGGATTSLFDKAIDPNISDWSPPLLLGLSFQYLPPPPPTQQVRPTSAQYVRSSSAPVRPQQVKDIPVQSSLQYDEQLRKRPSSSRGYRTVDNRRPYSRATNSSKQKASISPLVNSISAFSDMPQQFMVQSNSNLANELPITKEDVDDDTMPSEVETILDGLSDNEISSPLSSSTSDEPVTTRDKIQPHRLAYSVTAESAFTPRLTIPTQHPTSANLAKRSEKKVNFIDPAPSASSAGIQESEVGGMIIEIIQRAKEQCESNEATLSAGTGIKGPTVDTSDFMSMPDTVAGATDLTKSSSNIRTAKDAKSEGRGDTREENDHSKSDTQNDNINKTADNQNSHPSPQTTSINNDSDNSVDSITPGKASYPPDELVKQTSLLSTTTSTLVDQPITSEKQPNPLARKTSIVSGKAAQTKKIKTSPSTKTVSPKNTKQPHSKQTTKQSTTSKAVKQPKKPNKMDQDWKKTILQKVKK